MNEFFKYITPVVYWILVIIWLYIFIFFIKKINRKGAGDKLLNLLLAILAIDAFRTLFESFYFGTRVTALSGLLPIEVYNFLAKPQIVFLPKTVNLITAILVLAILIKRWLPAEIKQKKQINSLIEKQVSELSEANRKLVIAREEIAKSEEKYRLLAENSTDVVWLLDMDFNFLYSSPSTEKLFGYSLEERKTIAFDKLYGSKTMLRLKEIISEKKAEYYKTRKVETIIIELEGIHKDGNTIYLEVSAKFALDSKHNIIGIQGISRDIKERKQYEQKLIKAKEKAEEANRLKTQFLQNMSHEIRTPLNGIMGFSNILDKPGISDEKRKNYSNIIQNSSNQLLKIIDDILTISTLETKQEKLHETVFCLNDFLMELFAKFSLKATKKNISIDIKKELNDKQSYILTDRTKLNKILSNLFENALKFTKDGFIEIGYLIDLDILKIYVKDTGIGISAKNHHIVFERFSQEDKEISKKYGGLGLGLSISKENAQLLGGDINLESEKGKGSTFYVTIPYKPIHSEKDKEVNDREIKAEKKDQYKILIAEDEEVNYLYLETLFEDEFKINSKTLHAKNGKEAVELCQKHSDINLVLMDLKMPVMNGTEATSLIKEIKPKLPIIAQTAYTTSEDKEKAFTSGCDDFITKPIDVLVLEKLVKLYLNVKEL